jgi:hypothetical protein
MNRSFYWMCFTLNLRDRVLFSVAIPQTYYICLVQSHYCWSKCFLGCFVKQSPVMILWMNCERRSMHHFRTGWISTSSQDHCLNQTEIWRARLGRQNASIERNWYSTSSYSNGTERVWSVSGLLWPREQNFDGRFIFTFTLQNLNDLKGFVSGWSDEHKEDR